MSEIVQDQFFKIITHKVPAQHLREHPHAVVNEPTTLFLSVKQYVPLSNPTPQEGDLTIILSPAAGIVKEAYEPFLHDLVTHLSSHGARIRAIWTADPAQLSQSALLNKNNLGNHFSWFDHSRDLLCLIQQFKDQMVRPLIGVGHSMGGCQIIWLALMHPGLFESLVLIDPNILRVDHDQSVVAMAKMMLRRRETWESREQAENAVRRNPFYRNWDPRVVETLLKYHIVDARESASAELQASFSSDTQVKGQVVTATPRNVEFNTMFALTRTGGTIAGIRGIDKNLSEPIASSGATALYSWYPSGSVKIALFLPYLKCKVFYVVGGDSEFSTRDLLAQRMRDTGTGFDGSGGAAAGMVGMHVVKGGGHFDVFDKDKGAEVVNATGKNLVSVWKAFQERGGQRKEWQDMDPRRRQRPNKELVGALEAWNLKGVKTFDQVVEERSKSETEVIATVKVKAKI